MKALWTEGELADVYTERGLKIGEETFASEISSTVFCALLRSTDVNILK